MKRATSLLLTSDMEQQLEAFYKKYAPQNVPHVSKVLQDFVLNGEGMVEVRWAEFCGKLQEKYGDKPRPPGAAAPAATPDTMPAAESAGSKPGMMPGAGMMPRAESSGSMPGMMPGVEAAASNLPPSKPAAAGDEEFGGFGQAGAASADEFADFGQAGSGAADDEFAAFGQAGTAGGGGDEFAAFGQADTAGGGGDEFAAFGQAGATSTGASGAGTMAQELGSLPGSSVGGAPAPAVPSVQMSVMPPVSSAAGGSEFGFEQAASADASGAGTDVADILDWHDSQAC